MFGKSSKKLAKNLETIKNQRKVIEGFETSLDDSLDRISKLEKERDSLKEALKENTKSLIKTEKYLSDKLRDLLCPVGELGFDIDKLVAAYNTDPESARKAIELFGLLVGDQVTNVKNMSFSDAIKRIPDHYLEQEFMHVPGSEVTKDTYREFAKRMHEVTKLA